MIHWTGNGYKPFVVLIGINIVLQSILPAGLNKYVLIVALIIAGFYSWKKGNEWNKTKDYSRDEKNEDFARKKHSFFFINIQYWGFIFWFFAIIELSKISVWQTITFIIISLIYFASKYFSVNPLKLLYSIDISAKNKSEKINLEKRTDAKEKEIEIQKIKSKYDKKYNKKKKKFSPNEKY